jgi:S1-C subfamily serine protease
MIQSRRQGVLTGAAVAGLLACVAPARAQDLRYPFPVRGQFTPQGMLVQLVGVGSEPERAGLQRGDLITKIDNETITNQGDMIRTINTSGGSVVLTVRKPTGRMMRLNLNLKGAVVKGGVAGPYMLGVAGLYRADGMLIKVVAACSPASRAGLQPNDLILRINGELIRNQRDLFTILNTSGGTVNLDVRKAATAQVVRLTVDLKLYELGAIGEFTTQGMRIRAVSPATPAAFIGLQSGDVITSIDNRFIRSQREFEAALRNSGGSILLTVRKAPLGTQVQLRADLINNPLGAWCEPSTDGVRLTSVPLGTPASVLGLERGDVIIKVDNTRVRTNKQLARALNESGGVATLIVRKDGTNVLVKLEAVLGW